MDATTCFTTQRPTMDTMTCFSRRSLSLIGSAFIVFMSLGLIIKGYNAEQQRRLESSSSSEELIDSAVPTSSALEAQKENSSSSSSLRGLPRQEDQDKQVVEEEESESDEVIIPGGRRTIAQREAIRECIHWAVGLEHESMLVHRSENGMEEYAIDANKVLREMARYGEIHGLTKEEHATAVQSNDDGAEFSGRRCANSIDLTYKTMMESVSTDALENTFDGVHDQIKSIDNIFLKMANLHPFIKKVQKEQGLGRVQRPLTGMSSQLGMYQRTGGGWYKCASCGDCNVKDYTGSYHMSISIPSTSEGEVARDPSILTAEGTCAPKDESTVAGPSSKHWWDRTPSEEQVKKRQRKDWIDANMNLANMVQWIEPLLIAAHGSADADSICDNGIHTEGSFRSMRTGWGVPGTTDVRTFHLYGVGRYIKEHFDWVFPANETEGIMPSAYREDLSGCMKEGMGADIRTKTSVDEHYLKPGELLPPMTVGRGIEIRIFDNMPIEYIPQVYRMIAFVAEAGRNFVAPEYIYDNADWASAMQAVMREGWNAILPEGYVRDMAAAQNLDVDSFMQDHVGQNYQAFHVFTKLYEVMWKLHSKSFWPKLLLDSSTLSDDMPDLVNPNRESWELGAISNGYTSDRVLDTLGLIATGVTVQMTDVHDFHLQEESSCGEDLEDLVYLAERFGMVSDIKINAQGLIESFYVKERNDWNESSFEAPVCMSR